MLINLSNSNIVNHLLKSQSVRPEQLYLHSGKRALHVSRIASEGLFALECELSQTALLYLSACDLFEELDCCYKVLSKAMSDEDPDDFVPVIQQLVVRFKHIATTNFDLAYAYLAWHTSDDYPVMHHLIVALTAAKIAMQSQMFCEEEVDSVVSAALTMNISMLSLQARLRTQVESLSRDQKEMIRKHPEQSADKLQLLGVHDNAWLEVVRAHHELPDGSGYPRQIKCENPAAVLLSVCDSFNARMAQREYRKNFTAEQAVKDLFEIGDAVYSNFTAILLEELGIYPAGSLVQLAGNQIGCSLIRGQTAITPVVLVFRNLNKSGVGAEIVDTSVSGSGVNNAIPRRDLGDLPSLLELIARVV
ncbi:MAG TPA: HD domain-containing phosphohydrolase [Limnobacter sp.]|uniref:HD-GYP domain-containing protein n=1 Tax=Limnobacter sp. TaxID=2003368 RepID=UPI002E36350A|nr:HD domain-containing phosphohydrolase [Limnobacter sp.]HEX5486458.1 HD domain-containing phosphohydrolase [Limnobacter sp.]